MRVFLALGVALFVLMTVAVVVLSNQDLPPGELSRRCEASHPAWNGYQEDIKEIGARPVAQWKGHPTIAVIVGATLRLSFELELPWSDWDAALPVLVKTPEGQVLRNARHLRDDNVLVYEFDVLSDPALPQPPWVEIQYPHTRQRLHLNGQGVWTGDEGP